VNFSNAGLSNTDLNGARLIGARLIKANLSGANLRGANLSEAILNGANLKRANFNKANLSRANLVGNNLVEVDLSKANLVEVDLSEANLKGVNLNGKDLSGVIISNTNLSGANLNNSIIKNVRFKKANLRNTSMLDIKIDKFTDFGVADIFEGLIIDRFTLESLKDYGGLTTGDRMQMDIRDDVALLRSKFSGFWQWIHLIGMLLFLFPYTWFAFKMWIVAKFNYSKENSITIAEAFGRYIVSGGDKWHEGWNYKWFAITVFGIAIAYNVLRGMLLYKTKSLELKETISGLPQRFSLKDSKWGKIYTASRIVLFIFVLVVIWHTIHFLTIRVPVS